MKIEIDTRESTDTITILNFFLDSSVRMLDVGDILIDNKIVFEHKTPDDFIASTFDGRLFSQIVQMQENYPHSFIVVSAPMSDILKAARKINRENSIIASIGSCFVRGCPIIFCDTLANMASIIMILGEKLTDDKIRSRPVVRVKLKDEKIQFLCALPGVSPKRGKAILEKFGTVKQALRATSKELQEVDGIGEITADKIRKVIDS